MNTLPTDAADRNEFPMADGLLYYFPAALAAVSNCSKKGNEQHNKGEPLHWAMDKSTDHANKIMRHLMEVGTDDTDGVPHSVKVAWRALALAQEDLMARKGAPMPRNGRKGESPQEMLERVLTPSVRTLTPEEIATIRLQSAPNCDAFARDDEATGL
ncbi:MAG TPA: dATP/dGTP diphosphohydrolase domain-containing protein [Rhodanobacter sp.]|nr:dATP/dGTP diphosphohydrolase domain-containing protein [Rhodanobacter sp.]